MVFYILFDVAVATSLICCVLASFKYIIFLEHSECRRRPNPRSRNLLLLSPLKLRRSTPIPTGSMRITRVESYRNSIALRKLILLQPSLKCMQYPISSVVIGPSKWNTSGTWEERSVPMKELN